MARTQMTSAQRQFVAKVEGVEGKWNSKSGGNRTADATKVYNGGEVDPEVLGSPAATEDITVSRGFKQYRDAPILAKLRQKVGGLRTTVSVSPTDEDLVVIGRPVVYSDALLIGVTEPDYDAASGDAAMYELTFAVGSVR